MTFLPKEYVIKSQIFFMTMLYASFLFLCYKYVISPKFSYTYGAFYDHNLIVTTGLFVLAILPALLMQSDLIKPSVFFTWYIYLILYVPITILCIHAFEVLNINIIFFNIATFFGFLLIIYVQQIKLYDLNKYIKFDSYSSFIYILFFICFLSVIFIFYNTSIKILDLNIYEVYTARSAFKEELAFSSPIIGYIISFLLSVFSPALLILALYERKVFFIIFSIFCELFIYSIAGHKSALFLPLFLIALWFFLGNKKKITFLFFEITVSSTLIIFLIIDNFLFKSLVLSSLFTRRLILLHGSLTAFYVKYFSEIGYRYFTENSIIKWFNNACENISEVTPYVIGRVFLNKPNCHANENFWANAYADLGIWGVLLMSALLAMVLYIFDLLSYNKNKRLCICLTFASFINFLSTNFTTALFSGGVFFSLLIVFFIRKEP